MNMEMILKNKQIPAGAVPIAEQLAGNGERVLFAIVGDLSLKGKYADTVVFFTEKALVAYDGVPGESQRYAYADMEDVVSKRMYGNATLSAKMKDGRRRVFFRYTYAVAALCDAAALFVAHVREGADLQEEVAVMAVTFERALSVCPKCGVRCCTRVPSVSCAAPKRRSSKSCISTSSRRCR